MNTNAIEDETNPDLKGLKEGEFRLRIGGEGTGVQINKKTDIMFGSVLSCFVGITIIGSIIW